MPIVGYTSMKRLTQLIISSLSAHTHVMSQITDLPEIPNIYYAQCSTLGSVNTKVVSCTGFKLVTGARIVVNFTYDNTSSSPKLNVNNTGAKSIYYGSSNIAKSYIESNGTYEFIYNGSVYKLIGYIKPSILASSSSSGLMDSTDKSFIDNLRKGISSHYSATWKLISDHRSEVGDGLEKTIQFSSGYYSEFEFIYSSSSLVDDVLVNADVLHVPVLKGISYKRGSSTSQITCSISDSSMVTSSGGTGYALKYTVGNGIRYVVLGR